MSNSQVLGIENSLVNKFRFGLTVVGGLMLIVSFVFMYRESQKKSTFNVEMRNYSLESVAGIFALLLLSWVAPYLRVQIKKCKNGKKGPAVVWKTNLGYGATTLSVPLSQNNHSPA